MENWIRMSERLPEMGEIVQILVINDENGGREYDEPEIYTGYPYQEDSGWVFWTIMNPEYEANEMISSRIVTHWRPLPNFPPEDEWRCEYKIQSALWSKTHPDELDFID